MDNVEGLQGQLVNVPIAAGKTVVVPHGGSTLELVIATAPVNVRPRSKRHNYAYSTLQQGQGIEGAKFDVVDIQNPTDFPVVVSIWIGSAGFINRQLILSNVTTANVVNPTYSHPSTAATLNIPDLSGQNFTDVNGGKWIALNRIAILVFNLHASDVYLLQKSGATGSGDACVGAVQPLTPVRFDYSGDFTIASGSIEAIVSEIYNAIPQT